MQTFKQPPSSQSLLEQESLQYVQFMTPFTVYLFWHTPFGRHSSCLGKSLTSLPGGNGRFKAQQLGEFGHFAKSVSMVTTPLGKKQSHETEGMKIVVHIMTEPTRRIIPKIEHSMILEYQQALRLSYSEGVGNGDTRNWVLGAFQIASWLPAIHVDWQFPT